MNRKFLGAALAVASLSAFAADDYVITEAGTYNFPQAAGPYAALSNAVANAGVTLTQTDETPGYSTVFSGFRAVANSTTTFYGTFFDFGGGTFFDSTEKGTRRSAYLKSGAIVSNVASVTIGIYWSDNNRVELDGASEMHVAGDFKVGCQGNSCPQNDQVNVLDGSTLVVGGALSVGAADSGADARMDMDNRLVISNADTYVKTKTLNISAANVGGNRVWVTDHARVDVTGNLNVSSDAGSRRTKNQLYISDGGVVTAGAVSVSTGWNNTWDGRPSDDGIFVLDGGELYVKGDLRMGYQSSHVAKSGAKLIVSNGVLGVMGKFTPYGSGTNNRDFEVRFSGPRAKLNVSSLGTTMFQVGPYNRFIVENGAQMAFPWQNFCYTSVSRNESVIVRDEGTKMTFGTLGTSGGAANPNGIQSYTNRFVVTDGALVRGGALFVGGQGGRLEITNATLAVTSTQYERFTKEPMGSGSMPALTVGGVLQYGGISTNCVVSLSGTSPRLVCEAGASAEFRRSTTLVFNLPEAGYGADVVPFDVGKMLTMDASCKIELNGVAEMGAALAAKPGRNQTLIRAKTLNIPASVLDATRTTLPKGYRLLLVGNAGVEQRLVLHKLAGLAIIIR